MVTQRVRLTYGGPISRQQDALGWMREGCYGGSCSTSGDWFVLKAIGRKKIFKLPKKVENDC